MHPTTDVILASGSPRRRSILGAAGIAFEVMVPAIDDARFAPDARDPRRFVMCLAWFKARQVAADAERRWGTGGPRWVVAADTMCVHGGQVLGKPADDRDALAMLRGFRDRSHDVVTGLCVLDRSCGARTIVADSACVALGSLADAELESYASGGAWRGKAGGYNFADRVEAGWPLSCDGDPETVMGLPSRILLPLLRGEAASR